MIIDELMRNIPNMSLKSFSQRIFLHTRDWTVKNLGYSEARDSTVDSSNFPIWSIKHPEVPVTPDMAVYSESNNKLGAEAEVNKEIKQARVESEAVAIVGQITVLPAAAVEAAPAVAMLGSWSCSVSSSSTCGSSIKSSSNSSSTRRQFRGKGNNKIAIPEGAWTRTERNHKFSSASRDAKESKDNNSWFDIKSSISEINQS